MKIIKNDYVVLSESPSFSYQNHYAVAHMKTFYAKLCEKNVHAWLFWTNYQGHATSVC